MAEDRKNLYLELGKTGINRWGGYLAEEWLPELRGSRGTKIYQEMADNDPIVGAVIRAIKLLCRQASWRVEAAGRDREHQQAADFLQTCLDDMSQSWHDTLSDILSFLVHGWSYHEIVYKRRMGDRRDPTQRSKFTDGKLGWRKLPIRAQSTLYEWVFDDEGGLQAMRQSAPPDYEIVTIPIEKALLFRTESAKGSPEGVSILRNAYRPWYYKQNMEAIEAIGVERDLAGLPVVWVPESVVRGDSPEDVSLRNQFLQLVTRIRRDQQEGIVMPLAYDPASGNKRYELQLLTTGGRRQFEINDIIQRYDSRIAQTVLADFILLGTQKVGTYNLASNKARLFTLAITAFLDEIQEVMNAHAIPRLFQLNGMPTDRLPRLVHGDIDEVDLGELASFIQRLSNAGAALFPNDNLEHHLLRLANLPAEEA